MPAYVIADVEVADPEAYKEYTSGVLATVEAFGGRFVVRGGTVDRLEGDWDPERIVLVEFPDLASARAWYDSPRYQELAPKRQAASRRGSLIAVEGVG